jgi:hypothetical protein
MRSFFVLTLAMLLTVAASAAVKDLTCSNTEKPTWSIAVSFDDGNKTATSDYSQHPSDPTWHPATITPGSVHWDATVANVGNGVDRFEIGFDLNRMTGVLTVNDTRYSAPPVLNKPYTSHTTWQCEVAQQKF